MSEVNPMEVLSEWNKAPNYTIPIAEIYGE